ncbi:putative aflatoxin biosynthesis ketoreductase nor-1 [Phaeosphaeria sp. MPI-PUGE-AT-0046c]|nr:putative aflatoxin biosynthesis ketoreductase nor-1 [Phaeosphaeria sp. MPI-PUGE-AT-0046c]
MTTPSSTTLVTGSERGIGRGILTTLLSRPSSTVIACVRNPSTPGATALQDIPKAPDTTLHIVKIDSTSSTDAESAVQTLRDAGVTTIDTIIASAAIADTAAAVLDTHPEDVMRHMQVNVAGILVLFRAFAPLLRSAPSPKFIALSSPLGSTTLVPSVLGPWFCYGVTKAALNYMLRRIHLENEWLSVVALSPGWVKTEMGNFAAKSVGMEEAPLTVEESVKGCFVIIDQLKREKWSGEFVDTKGESVAW